MSQLSMDILTFKCVILGHRGCGKTTFLQSHLTGAYERIYKPTRTAEESCLTFTTSRGPICFNVWETAGQEEHYADSKCAIIMYDMVSRATYEAVPKLAARLGRICRNIPTAMVVNKCDAFTKDTQLWNSSDEIFICVKLKSQLGSPFLWLAQKLFGDPHLKFVPMTALAPPYVPISRDEQLRILRDLPGLPKIDNDDIF